MTTEQTEKLEKIFEIIKNQLEPGIEYYTYETNRSQQPFYKITDGRIDDNVPEVIHWKNKRENLKGTDLNILKAVYETDEDLEPGKMNFFTLSKEKGFTNKTVDAKLIVELMKLELLSDTNLDSGRREESFIKIIPGKNPDKPNLDVFTKIYDANGDIRDSDFAEVDKYIECLYHNLDKKLEIIYTFTSEKNVDIQTIPEIPGLTQLYAPVEDLSLDPSDIEKVYVFLESWSDAKIAKAIEIINVNPDLKADIEKRYLNLIKLRVGENAGLESFAKASLRRKEFNLLNGEHFDKNFISLSYFSEEECELVVNFIGSLVLNYLDINKFKSEAESTATLSDLIQLYSEAAEIVKKGILEEATKNPDGWFSKLSVKFANHKIEKVLFEKTHFRIPNSPQLKAFIFYLAMNNKKAVYLDVFQSYMDELTEFFWFLPDVPKSSWGDTSLALPECTLGFQRVVVYRLGDGKRWKSKNFPEKTNS